MDATSEIWKAQADSVDLKVHGLRSRDVKGGFTVRHVYRKRFMSTRVIFRCASSFAERVVSWRSLSSSRRRERTGGQMIVREDTETVSADARECVIHREMIHWRRWGGERECMNIERVWGGVSINREELAARRDASCLRTSKATMAEWMKGMYPANEEMK